MYPLPSQNINFEEQTADRQPTADRSPFLVDLVDNPFHPHVLVPIEEIPESDPEDDISEDFEMENPGVPLLDGIGPAKLVSDLGNDLWISGQMVNTDVAHFVLLNPDGSQSQKPFFHPMEFPGFEIIANDVVPRDPNMYGFNLLFKDTRSSKYLIRLHSADTGEDRDHVFDQRMVIFKDENTFLEMKDKIRKQLELIGKICRSRIREGAPHLKSPPQPRFRIGEPAPVRRSYPDVRPRPY